VLTFEKLVQEIAQRVMTTNPDITPALVRDVLTDTGIDDCLRDTTPPPQGRLIVHNVTVAGEKRRTEAPSESFTYHRTLGTGLWAWVGGNGTGKSTILNCIIWALTGSDSGIPKRVRPWLRDILVQFSLGDERFTSHIERSGEGTLGGIYRDFLTLDQIHLGSIEPVVLFSNRDELREAIDMFFMQRLGITTLRWTAHSPEKDDPDLHAHSTTWRTYAHAIHIEDDSYDDLIIDPMKGYGRQDRKILEMMLGVEHTRAVAEIQVQADFAKEAFGRARSRVSGKETAVSDQIMALEVEQAEVQQSIELMAQHQAPVEADTVFVQKRERRSEGLNEQNRLVQEIATLEAQQAAIQGDILVAERELVALREQSEVEYLINSLVVVRCPHCESAVDHQERLVMERQNHTCHVCSQPIQRTRMQGDLKAILREREQEISTLKSALRRAQQDHAARQKRLAESREETEQLGRELETNVQQAREGFSTTYANLLVRKGQIDGQLEQLRLSLSAMEAEQMEVETAAKWNTVLQATAEIADQAVFQQNEDVFTKLGALTVRLATRFGLPDLEQVTIDEKRYVRLCQGNMILTHNDLARSERVKFKIAFHLALALLRTNNGVGRHPGFLVIDTPGTSEVDEADFVAITEHIANIHRAYGGQIQILLATARPEAVSYLPAELVAKAENGAFF
jgi:hypothetical protein